MPGGCPGRLRPRARADRRSGGGPRPRDGRSRGAGTHPRARPVGTVRGAIADRRLHPDGPDGPIVSPPAPILVGRGPHQDPVQPAVEPLDVAQLGQLTPAADERLLDGVLGELRVAQDESGDRMEAVDLAGSELPEGLPIPEPRSLDEPCRIWAAVVAPVVRPVVNPMTGVKARMVQSPRIRGTEPRSTMADAGCPARSNRASVGWRVSTCPVP